MRDGCSLLSPLHHTEPLLKLSAKARKRHVPTAYLSHLLVGYHTLREGTFATLASTHGHPSAGLMQAPTPLHTAPPAHATGRKPRHSHTKPLGIISASKPVMLHALGNSHPGAPLHASGNTLHAAGHSLQAHTQPHFASSFVLFGSIPVLLAASDAPASPLTNFSAPNSSATQPPSNLHMEENLSACACAAFDVDEDESIILTFLGHLFPADDNYPAENYHQLVVDAEHATIHPAINAAHTVTQVAGDHADGSFHKAAHHGATLLPPKEDAAAIHAAEQSSNPATNTSTNAPVNTDAANPSLSQGTQVILHSYFLSTLDFPTTYTGFVPLSLAHHSHTLLFGKLFHSTPQPFTAAMNAGASATIMSSGHILKGLKPTPNGCLFPSISTICDPGRLAESALIVPPTGTTNQPKQALRAPLGGAHSTQILAGIVIATSMAHYLTQASFWASPLLPHKQAPSKCAILSSSTCVFDPSGQVDNPCHLYNQLSSKYTVSSPSTQTQRDGFVLSSHLRGRMSGLQAREITYALDQTKSFKAQPQHRSELLIFFIEKSMIDPG